MTTWRFDTKKRDSAAAASGVEYAEAATGVAGTRAPVDFTGQRVIFSDGAPVPLSPTRAALHWFHEHNHVHVPHLPPPRPEKSVRHYVYLEQALLSREMDRL